MKFRFLTAGESHGPSLNIIVEGLPSGLTVLASDIDHQLRRRQGGYGRGARMKIETDTAEITGGIRHGQTMGGPVSLTIQNRDHQKWLKTMSPDPLSVEDDADSEIQNELKAKYISRVRPGHADYAGAIKYNHQDVRNVLERSSARETTSRVAAGAIARSVLKACGIEVYSHVIQLGQIDASQSPLRLSDDLCGYMTDEEYVDVEASPLRCKDKDLTSRMIAEIDAARKVGETLGGIVELIVTGMPVGIGSHVHWDRRLDGMLAQALMSVHTVKSVSVGLGEMAGQLPGSQVHDEIIMNTSSKSMRYAHATNRAGGIEGGISNGESLVLRAVLKPIPTLARTEENSLRSINLQTKTEDKAFYERSDVCVVPAGGVVCEAMVAIILADQLMQKFGGDSLEEMLSNLNNYREYCANR